MLGHRFSLIRKTLKNEPLSGRFSSSLVIYAICCDVVVIADIQVCTNKSLFMTHVKYLVEP